MLCNTWNQQKRWPKAYLNISNPETDQNDFIVLNENIDLQQGIHQELFDVSFQGRLCVVCSLKECSD